MYDFVLITTGRNAVRKIVEDNVRQFFVIDCANGKNVALKELKYCLNNGVKNLVTYRCPYIIPQNLYSKVRVGAYNIHPSLLPDFPGLNPWFEIFEKNIKRTGVTIHCMSAIPDTGKIICQEAFDIECNDSIETARKKADVIASNLLLKILKND